MTQTLDTPVLVAGGGPTGLVLASVLSHYGINCVLVERNTHTTRFPKMDVTNGASMELLRRLSSGPRKLPVIVMTGHGDVPLAVEAMKLGALDFLEKPFEDDRLIGMIQSALAGSESGSKSEALAADMAARVASLTQRERQVMQGLVTGQSNKSIAREYDISPRTVEVYRANVMTKMQAGNLSELVRFAIRAGIVED